MPRATDFPRVTGYVVAGVAKLVFRKCKHQNQPRKSTRARLVCLSSPLQPSSGTLPGDDYGRVLFPNRMTNASGKRSICTMIVLDKIVWQIGKLTDTLDVYRGYDTTVPPVAAWAAVVGDYSSWYVLG